MLEDLLEVWRVHEEINSFLLENIPDEGFTSVPLLKTGKPSTGRTVARAFAHLHQVRVMHLGAALTQGIPQFESSASPSRKDLIAAFRASSQAVE
jgi:hypothetical protein